MCTLFLLSMFWGQVLEHETRLPKLVSDILVLEGQRGATHFFMCLKKKCIYESSFLKSAREGQGRLI